PSLKSCCVMQIPSSGVPDESLTVPVTRCALRVEDVELLLGLGDADAECVGVAVDDTDGLADALGDALVVGVGLLAAWGVLFPHEASATRIKVVRTRALMGLTLPYGRGRPPRPFGQSSSGRLD